MREHLDEWLHDLANRAGFGGVSTQVVIAAMVVLGLAVALAAWRWWPVAESSVVVTPEAESVHSPETTPTSAEASAAAPIWVHVVGAVRRPGLYDVVPGSRVEKAIEAAGGLLGNAAPEALNLARKVSDGEQIVVPTHDEAERGAARGGVPSAFGGASSSGGVGAASGSIDLNSATAAELDTLPGVGPATATKIVADREANGPFASVEDLGRVAGIGPKKLAELTDLVSVR